MLVLTNLVYNSFGGDGGGIQFFYACPVSFRQIVLGKNLTHASILAANTALPGSQSPIFMAPRIFAVYGRNRRRASVRCASELHRRQPALDLFAEEARLLHLRPSERLADDRPCELWCADRDCRIRRRSLRGRASLSNLWIATLMFLVLAAISIPLYLFVLRSLDGIALKRQETLLAELCRA